MQEGRFNSLKTHEPSPYGFEKQRENTTVKAQLQQEEMTTVIWPNPLFTQGRLESVPQDHVQMASEYLQGRRLRRHSGQPVPGLCQPHGDRVFSIVLVLPLDTPENSLALSFLHPSFRYLYRSGEHLKEVHFMG